jgi:hypothetical protein
MAIGEELSQPEKPAFSLDDLESGKIVLNPGWLKKIWGKWPGDESIEELLAALKDR